MTVETVGVRTRPPRVAWLDNPAVRAALFQAMLIAAFAWLLWSGVQNMFANLRAANIATGFGFLDRVAGFEISQSLLAYDQASSSYLDVYFVGLANTLLVAVLGIALATMTGFAVGIARLSRNWIARTLAGLYVESLRNVPVLLQIFIWYFAVLRLLPSRRESLDLGLFGQINVAGWYAPAPVFGEGSGLMLWALLLGGAAMLALSHWNRRRQIATGRTFPAFRTGLVLVAGLPAVAYFAAGQPVTFDFPAAGNFGPRGGARVYPELIALLLALSTYTAAFIAETVRAGILGVGKGQIEAAHALGIRPAPTLRLVVIPQAMRIIIPPLTSQYLNLTKNSSLAVAIAYPDLVSVFAGTALNQTGQAVEILLMTMLTYLGLSLATSLLMNWYNGRMALVER
jgi:general L-amino acid transport system permease protein